MKVRVKSTPKSITADVAMKQFFSRLKAANVMPRIAPPVPKSPAAKPDKEPPAIELKNVGLRVRFFKLTVVR